MSVALVRSQLQTPFLEDFLCLCNLSIMKLLEKTPTIWTENRMDRQQGGQSL